MLIRDIRYALRQLVKNPGFYSIVVLTLGIGIGANTAIFSLVDWLVLRSLPIRNPEQMHFLVLTRPAGSNEVQLSYPEFAEIKKQTADIFSGMVPYIFGGLSGAQNTPDGLTVDGVTNTIQTAYVGSEFFREMGITPAAGRFLSDGEGQAAGADPVVILSYNYWKTRFAGEPSIIGKAGFINGHPVTIVGVAPKGFLGPTPLIENQAYLPLGMYSVERGVSRDFLTNPKARSIVAFARIKPGIKADRMRSELALVGRRLLKEYPRDHEIGELRANRLRPPGLVSGQVNPLPKLAALFLTLAALVLALACVNVANLFLVRATARQREMAVRSALGAANSRLTRQLLTESLVVASLGCVIGIVFGLVTCRLLSTIRLQSELPIVLDFDFNWRTFAYSFLIAAAAAVLVMIVPVIRVWRGNLRDILHEGGRSSTARHQRLRTALVTSEVAACLILLVISGLFVRSLRGVQKTELGFSPQAVLNITFDANEIGYSEAQGRALYTALLDRSRALPGVQSASLGSAIPLDDNASGNALVIPGVMAIPNQPAPNALYSAVSPDYFRTNQIVLIRGRDFSAADNESSTAVTVINRAMADRYWPGQDPLGRSFATAADPSHPVTIVGIVGNVRMNELYGPFEFVYYRPVRQSYEGVETLQIRSDRSPQELQLEVRDIARSLSPVIPIYGVRTMNEVLHGGNGLLLFELGASLAGSLGCLGLVLALVGVYGLMSYAISQRIQEIGIRMALGAQRSDILRTLGGQGLVIVGAGLTTGLLASLAVGQMVGDFLVGVKPNDPITYFGVSALLAAVALLASYVPARRACRIDPLTALRHE